MTYSKQTLSFAKDLVSYYSKFDKYSQSYALNIDDINDFDVHAFSTFMMIEDEMAGAEATGADNPAYEKTMRPALLKYMKDTTDRYLKTEFTEAWSNGIASYFKKQMQELLNELCVDRTHDEFNDEGLYARHTPDNGELYWSKQA